MSTNVDFKEFMMPVEAWLQNNVMGWQQLTCDEKTALRDFPILWAYFEGWVTFPNTGNLRIIAAKVDMLLENKLQNLDATNAAYDHYRNRFFPDGHKAEIFERLRLLDADKTFVESTLTNVMSKARDRMKAVLYIINRLRNNYFHGAKALCNFEGQLKNFQHANATLMEVLPLWGAPHL